MTLSPPPSCYVQEDKPDDEQENRWKEEIQRRRGLWVQVQNALIDGAAMRSIRHADTIRVFLIFMSKAPLPPTRRRKRDQRRALAASPDLFFSFAEAVYRGITRKSFARAVRELVAAGLIDVIHRGSGMRGDPSKYRLSERWRKFNESDFEKIDFAPRSDEKAGILRNQATGCWTKTRFRKKSASRNSHGAEIGPYSRAGIGPCNTSTRAGIGPYLPRFQPGAKGQVLPQSEDLPGVSMILGGSEKELKGQEIDGGPMRCDFATTSLTSHGDFDGAPWAEDEPLIMAYAWGEEATL